MKSKTILLIVASFFMFSTNTTKAFDSTEKTSVDVKVEMDEISNYCVNRSRNITLGIAELNGDDPNGDRFDYYLDWYMLLYTDCLANG